MKYVDITALKQTIARLVERQITPAMDGSKTVCQIAATRDRRADDEGPS